MGAAAVSGPRRRRPHVSASTKMKPRRASHQSHPRHLTWARRRAARLPVAIGCARLYLGGIASTAVAAPLASRRPRRSTRGQRGQRGHSTARRLNIVPSAVHVSTTSLPCCHAAMRALKHRRPQSIVSTPLPQFAHPQPSCAKKHVLACSGRPVVDAATGTGVWRRVVQVGLCWHTRTCSTALLVQTPTLATRLD